MPSAVSLGTSANSSSVPIVVFMDMQQEYLAKLRLLVISRLAFFNPETPSVRWIKGFEPCPDELIFERSSPSCYSGEPFTALVNRSHSGSCWRDFREMYRCNASASHALDEMPAGDVHRAVSKISGIYAEVFETDDWIEQTLPRNHGYGKNAGG